MGSTQSARHRSHLVSKTEFKRVAEKYLQLHKHQVRPTFSHLWYPGTGPEGSPLRFNTHHPCRL